MNKILIILAIFLSLTSFANNLSYDFSDTTSIPINLKITKEISTKEGLIEGSKVNFKVVKSVFYNGNYLVKKGDIVQATVETFITRGFNGFPAEIVIDNFEFENIKKSQLQSTYTSVGANRCFWVFPIKWALTPIPFVGSFTNFILGGEAKIKTDDVITIYYFPNWK